MHISWLSSPVCESKPYLRVSGALMQVLSSSLQYCRTVGLATVVESCVDSNQVARDSPASTCPRWDGMSSEKVSALAGALFHKHLQVFTPCARLPPRSMAYYSTAIVLSSIRELIQGKHSCDSRHPRYAPALEVLSVTKKETWRKNT